MATPNEVMITPYTDYSIAVLRSTVRCFRIVTRGVNDSNTIIAAK